MLVNLEGEYLLDKFYFGLFEVIQDDIKIGNSLNILYFLIMKKYQVY